MTQLSEREISQIISYTGMDLVLALPVWHVIPVVHYTRDKYGRVQFITIVKEGSDISVIGRGMIE